METTCERCWRPMRQEGSEPNAPRVCTLCRLAACGLDPEQIAKTTGIPSGRWVIADPLPERQPSGKAVSRVP